MLSASSFTLPSHKCRGDLGQTSARAPLCAELGALHPCACVCWASRHLEAAGLMVCRHIPLQSTPRFTTRRQTSLPPAATSALGNPFIRLMNMDATPAAVAWNSYAGG